MAEVKPRMMRGLRDLFPEDMHAREWIVSTIRGVYENYGYVPLATPAMEYLDVLSGSAGEETQKELFTVAGPGEEPLGLRFDQTVPLARVVAQYRDLPRPFRRYQVAPVWRCEMRPNEKRGRLREFTQFDIDAVGVKSEVADVEMITAMCDTMDALGVAKYRVRVSSRRVLNLLLPHAGIDTDRAHDVFRVLDKLEKLGPEKVRLELTTGYKDESGAPIRGQGFSDAQVDRIDEFLAIQSDRRDDVLAQVRSLFEDVPGSDAELDVLANMSRQLSTLGYGDDRVMFDPRLARGLAYYTGTVFECVLLDLPKFGAIGGGGRYDELVMRFLGERVPAVGTSFGVDRLLIALQDLGRAPARKATAQVLVTVFDRKMMDHYLSMTYELRRAGIRTELYLGNAKRVGKQVEYGDKYEVPILVICGGDEAEKGIVQLKDMSVGREKTGEIKDRDEWKSERPGQFEVPRDKLVEEIKKLLATIEGE